MMLKHRRGTMTSTRRSTSIALRSIVLAWRSMIVA
ncbi:hypothetical protein ANCCAN_26298 [Ancylostoma caninum]|uniref:Uncharacterized protein n=1 Tax=Ancylostoma caninum TaxID=29170 RepID=A0A368F7A1_ANCCA|nr:hypothetical protein ANCCAN_26298 [Ancylostoma caninum]